MVEPTETESRETLDRFAETMEAIAAKARAEGPEAFHDLPVTTPVSRPDETTVPATRSCAGSSKNSPLRRQGAPGRRPLRSGPPVHWRQSCGRREKNVRSGDPRRRPRRAPGRRTRGRRRAEDRPRREGPPGRRLPQPGGIPTKALYAHIVGGKGPREGLWSRVEGIMDKLRQGSATALRMAGAKVVRGTATVVQWEGEKKISVRKEDGSGEEITGARLLLATGARSVRPAFAGNDLPEVLTGDWPSTTPPSGIRNGTGRCEPWRSSERGSSPWKWP